MKPKEMVRSILYALAQMDGQHWRRLHLHFNLDRGVYLAY